MDRDAQARTGRRGGQVKRKGKREGYYPNRCCVCCKFRKWEQLTKLNFTPDTEFTAENIEYTCIYCQRYGSVLLPVREWLSIVVILIAAELDEIRDRKNG